MSNQISERIKQKIMYVGSVIDSCQHTYCATISSVSLGVFNGGGYLE